MNWTPILHFSGKFRFQMPGYNNAPQNQPVAFDPAKPIPDVQQLCECDPAKYFEFDFFDTSVRQVTYRDGTSSTTGDPGWGMSVNLSGFMVDVSPSAICAQIFPVQFGLGTLIQGTMAKAIQSDLRLSIRPLGFGDQTAAAHFETTVEVNGLMGPEGSRCGAELAGTHVLTLYFHLNHYTRIDNSAEPEGTHLTGDVYGYIRPAVPLRDPNGVRVANRRIVAHPDLGQARDIERTYLLEGVRSVIRITDIDGTYDFDVADQMIALRYLDFIPFLDRAYTTPNVSGYAVSALLSNSITEELDRFTGTHEEMLRTGGLYYSIAAFSEVRPDGSQNGIVAFNEPWKNVAATCYHELNEARTDPDVEDAIRTGQVGFTGWTSARGEEIGDAPIRTASGLNLVFKEVPLADGSEVPVQFMYSNAVHGPEGQISQPH